MRLIPSQMRGLLNACTRVRAEDERRQTLVRQEVTKSLERHNEKPR
jgi:hypothetical protein